jgi:hypothetical protein
MKTVGFAARLFAIAAVLSLALVATGCGNKDEGAGGTAATGGSQQYSSGDTVGEAKKVVVGTDSDLDAQQQAVITRIGEFGDATANHDYKKLCNELLSKEARKIGGNCVQTFEQTGKQIKDFKITVNDVKIASDGNHATATVDVTSNVNKAQQSQSLSLVKEGGQWRIQILGQ